MLPLARVPFTKDLFLENPFPFASCLTFVSLSGGVRLNIAQRGFLIWWRRRELILTALCHIKFAFCFCCNLHLKINQKPSK